jgi:hypothetical protein
MSKLNNATLLRERKGRYIKRLLHDIFNIGPDISPKLPYQARQRSWRADTRDINVDLSYPYTNSCFGMLWNYTAWLMLISFCDIRFMNDFESVCEYWSINVFEKHFKMPPNISYIIDHFGWHHNAIFELNDCLTDSKSFMKRMSQKLISINHAV